MIREYLEKRISEDTRQKLIQSPLARKVINFIDDVQATFFCRNLNRLAKIYRTDKYGTHYYTQHYQTHFKRFKYKRVRLLEIGVGGYEDPFIGGKSLRMWKKYFPFGKIYSIDIYDKSFLQENRIKIFQGSQVDKDFLEKVTVLSGDPDIIIDDGSHINEHVIETFKLLFPKLKDGGIYVIEDTQTSYWEDFGGSMDFRNPDTIMYFFKSLTDSLNNKEFICPGYEQNYYDRKIISIHFYHNLIVIYKGDNDEESNVVKNNQR
jgi:demethylmacrocin O-methyltransferase